MHIVKKDGKFSHNAMAEELRKFKYHHHHHSQLDKHVYSCHQQRSDVQLLIQRMNEVLSDGYVHHQDLCMITYFTNVFKKCKALCYPPKTQQNQNNNNNAQGLCVV